MYNHVLLYDEYGKLMENEPFAVFLDHYQKSDLLTREEKQALHEALHGMPVSAYLINENLFDVLKSGYQKAVDLAKELPDKAKDAFEKVVDAAKNAADFVKMLAGKLNESIKNVLNTVMTKMKELLSKDGKFVEAVKGLAKVDKESIIKDVKTMGEVLKFYKDKFVGALTKSAESAATKAMTSEAPPEQGAPGEGAKKQAAAVAESLINEGGNIVSTVIHFIEKYPPFSWLHEVAKLGEKGANAIIKGISSVTQKLGGPAFALPVLAVIVGLALEYNIKGLAKYGILDVAGMAAFPVITIAVKFVAYVATAIAAVILVDELLGLGILSKGHSSGHGSQPPAEGGAPAHATV